VLKKALSHFQERYSKDEAAAVAVITNGESVASSAVNKTELAAYTLLGNLILNLDETIHRN